MDGRTTYSRIRRAYKAKTKKPKQSTRVVRSLRSIVPQKLSALYNVALNTQSGWNGIDNSIQFQFTLDGVYARIGTGSLGLVAAWANSNYIAALYEFYRLVKVKTTIMCGSNASQINTTQQWSCIFCVVDRNDSIKLASAQDALSYDEMIPMQLGANGFDYGKQIVTFTGPSTNGVEDSNTGATGFASSQQQKSPWLNTLYTSVPHYGLKLYNNVPGGTASTQYIQFIFEVMCEVKGRS